MAAALPPAGWDTADQQHRPVSPGGRGGERPASRWPARIWSRTPGSVRRAGVGGFGTATSHEIRVATPSRHSAPPPAW